MATTSIWAVKGWLGKVVLYIYAASRLDFLRPESGESPTALQPKTPAKSTPERG